MFLLNNHVSYFNSANGSESPKIQLENMIKREKFETLTYTHISIPFWGEKIKRFEISNQGPFITLLGHLARIVPNIERQKLNSL